MSATGEKIKQYRKLRGLSQTKLAEMIGETKQTLWKYESGTVTNIPLAKVEALAEALACGPGQLLGWETEESGRLGGLAEEAATYLTGRETELLEKFRMLNRDNQDRLIREAQELLDGQRLPG